MGALCASPGPVLGLFWGCPGLIWGTFGLSWTSFGALLGLSGALLQLPGAILCLSCAVRGSLGLSWSCFGRVFGCLRALLGLCWAVLGLSWALLGLFWASLGAKIHEKPTFFMVFRLLLSSAFLDFTQQCQFEKTHPVSTKRSFLTLRGPQLKQQNPGNCRRGPLEHMMQCKC